MHNLYFPDQCLTAYYALPVNVQVRFWRVVSSKLLTILLLHWEGAMINLEPGTGTTWVSKLFSSTKPGIYEGHIWSMIHSSKAGSTPSNKLGHRILAAYKTHEQSRNVQDI